MLLKKLQFQQKKKFRIKILSKNERVGKKAYSFFFCRCYYFVKLYFDIAFVSTLVHLKNTNCTYENNFILIDTSSNSLY